MKISNLATRVATVALALGLLALWFFPAPPADENKAQAEPPTIAAGTLPTVDDVRSFAAYQYGHLGLKGASVALLAESHLALGVSPSSRVVLGPDERVYLATEFTQSCFTTETRKTIEDSIAAAQAAVEKSGGYFLYAVTPNKSFAERARLAAFWPQLGHCEDVNSAYIEALDHDGELPVFSAFGAFDEAQAAGETLYFAGDTHWNTAGASLFAQSLLERLQEDGEAPADLIQPGDVVVTDTVEHAGDLFRIAGAGRTELADVRVVVREGVTTVHDTEPLADGWVTEHWHSTSTGAPLITGRTLFIRDSMFGAQRDLYSPYFEDLTAVSVEAVNDPGELALLGDFDRVIVQRVQRSVGGGIAFVADLTWV